MDDRNLSFCQSCQARQGGSQLHYVSMGIYIRGANVFRLDCKMERNVSNYIERGNWQNRDELYSSIVLEGGGGIIQRPSDTRDVSEIQPIINFYDYKKVFFKDIAVHIHNLIYAWVSSGSLITQYRKNVFGKYLLVEPCPIC